VTISPGDVISGLALLVSIGAGFQSYFANGRAANAEKRAEELSEAAERRRLVDDVILEAHGLSDDVRLHGGDVVKTKQRAKVLEIKSGSYNNSSVALILNECEGKRITAEGLLQAAQPVISGGEESLKQRTHDELRVLLRDLRTARNKVAMQRDELRGLAEG